MADVRRSPDSSASHPIGSFSAITSRRNLGVGAALASGAQVLNAVVAGVTGILVARLLGPAGTGAFAILLSTVFILTSVSTLGIDIGLVYRVSGGRWRAADALRQSQLAALGLGIAGAGLGGAVAVLTADSAFAGIGSAEIALALAALPAALSVKVVGGIALSLEHYTAYAIGTSAQTVALLGLVAVLVPVFGFVGAAAALLASNVVAAGGMVMWGWHATPAPEPGWLRRSNHELRAAGSFGIRAYVTSVLSYLNQRADLFILNASAATAAVGRYSIAVSITSLGLMLPRALSSVAMPRIAALDASDQEDPVATVTASVRHAVAITGLCTLGLAAVMPAIPLVYGGDFGPSIKLGYILLPGVALFGLGSVLSAIVVGKGRPQYSLYAAIIVTPPTLLAYLVLVPSLAGEGAALASALSYAGSFIALLWFFAQVTGITDIRRLLPGASELQDYRRLATLGIARWRSRSVRRP